MTEFLAEKVTDILVDYGYYFEIMPVHVREQTEV